MAVNLGGISGSREPDPSCTGSGPFDPGRKEELELTAMDLWRDARLLSCAPRELLKANRDLMIEARECLNDALAKVDA